MNLNWRDMGGFYEGKGKRKKEKGKRKKLEFKKRVTERGCLVRLSVEMIAFKEWKVVCDALGLGRQDVLFRKGGIHEGREGFSFKHEEFVLFPTLFHGQAAGVRAGEVPEVRDREVGEIIEIEYFCEVSSAVTLTDWQEVLALRDRHVWTEEILRERFDWQGKGMTSGSINCAFVDVYRLAEPWKLPYEKGFGGCRSWLELPEPPDGWRESAVRV